MLCRPPEGEGFSHYSHSTPLKSTPLKKGAYVNTTAVTNLALIIPVIVAAFIALKREFAKAADKVEQVHKLVNSQLAETIAERDEAREQRNYAQKQNKILNKRINELLDTRDNP